MTKEEFITRANLLNNNKYSYDKVIYKNNYTKVIITCPIHGDFEQTPKNHLNGNQCPKCALINRSLKNCFVEKANKVHGNKYDYSKAEYKTNKDKICIICPKHGEFWQNVQSHLRGYGCPICSKEHYVSPVKLTQEEFIERSIKTHNGKYDYSKTNYIIGTEKVTIICPKHGEFQQQAIMHMRGAGCPKCRSSKGELQLLKLLKENFPNLEVKHQFKDEWLEKQHLDIYIPKYNIGIEYNGLQHYKAISTWGGENVLVEIQKRDNIKQQKCLEHNCKLFIVRYNKLEEDWQSILNYLHNIIGDND